MSDIAIKIENVSKQYRLGLVSTGTLSHDLNRWWATKVMRKEDPYLKIGEVNDRTTKGSSDYVWALKDINMEIKQGDVVGIIGKNGAGKSTLLKLLSRVTAPTTGTISYKGRIASLLEVGTGFHPELTGRENIYMNGAIMGMNKAEITRKLDEIVDFSGCERYLDTPVKRYSSGMTVRLGFAIAAHIEPDILVVDEVLAVGDAEFQKKAIGKMQDVSRGEGRTVLFVSHNMAAVRALCKSGFVLRNGQTVYNDTANKCVDYYMSFNKLNDCNSFSIITDKYRKVHRSKELEYVKVQMLNDVNNMASKEPIRLNLWVKRNDKKIEECQFGIAINNARGDEVGVCFSNNVHLLGKEEVFQVNVTLPYHQLAKGKYELVLSICNNNLIAKEKTFDVIYAPITFEVKYVDENHQIPFVSWDKLCSIQYGYSEVIIK